MTITTTERRTSRERRILEDRRRNRRRNLRRLAPVAILLLLLAIGSRLFERSPGDELNAAPDELLGTWVTSDARYAQSSFTIEPERVVLGLAPGNTTVHTITSIRRDSVPVHRVYQIRYATDDGEINFEVYAYDDGELRLRNPPEVTWTRAGEGEGL